MVPNWLLSVPAPAPTTGVKGKLEIVVEIAGIVLKLKGLYVGGKQQNEGKLPLAVLLVRLP